MIRDPRCVGSLPSTAATVSALGFMVLAGLAGCVGPADQTIDIPALHIGDQADYLRRGVSGEVLTVRIESMEEHLLLDGTQGRCLNLTWSSPDRSVSSCLAPGSWEVVHGVRRPLPGPSLEYPSSLGPPVFEDVLFVALKATGSSWTVGETRTLEWYGVPFDVTAQGWRDGTFEFLGEMHRFSVADPEKFETIEIRFGFQEGDSLPVHAGGRLDRTYTPSVKRVGEAQERGDTPVPDGEGPPWDTLQARLEPTGPPFPSGSGCPPEVTSLATIYDVLRDQAPGLHQFVQSAYLRYAEVRETRQDTIGTEFQETRLEFQDEEGEMRGFTVTRLKRLVGEPEYSVSDRDRWEEEPIVPGSYPPTTLPYCKTITMFSSLRPEASWVKIRFSPNEGPNPEDAILRSAVPGSSWGTNWVLTMHNWYNGSILTVNMATGTMANIHIQGDTAQ